MNTVMKKYYLLYDLRVTFQFIFYVSLIVVLLSTFLESFVLTEFSLIMIMLGVIVWRFPNEDKINRNIQKLQDMLEDSVNFTSFYGYLLIQLTASVIVFLLLNAVVFMAFNSLFFATTLAVVLFSLELYLSLTLYKSLENQTK